MMDRKMVNFIREQYPPGTRIRLNSMEDPYHPILPGTEGEVDFVDNEGQIFMKWDNGRTLPLIPGEDSFTVLPPKLTTLKLYMPLTADLYERNEYGEFDDSSTLLEGSELRGYQDQITAALVKNRMPEEAERGIMHWYDEADSVDRKVRSAVFTVEERDRQLWGVAECRVAGELSDAEMDTLKEFITGQASDGWCEGFEQREISVDDGGELYVHFWNSDEWSIQTEQELFALKLHEQNGMKMGGMTLGYTATAPNCWQKWDRRWRRETSSPSPAAPGAPPGRTSASRCASTGNGRIRGRICRKAERKEMIMNMARYEQETIIGFNEEEKTAGIYTHNKVLRQKLEALARDRPEDCRLVKVSRSGRAVDYVIPKSWIRIAPPRIASEAQKASLARARKAANKPL